MPIAEADSAKHFTEPLIRSDGAEGQLFSFELEKNCGFDAKRIYWIQNVPAGQSRGDHAHKTLQQFIFVVRGSVQVDIRSPNSSQTFALQEGEGGVHLQSGLWRSLHDFSTNAIVMVAASQAFDEGDYIRDWEQYCLWFDAR